MVSPPDRVLDPVRFNWPAPSLSRRPEPVMLPAYVEALERLRTTWVLLVRGPLPRLPLVPPTRLLAGVVPT